MYCFLICPNIKNKGSEWSYKKKTSNGKSCQRNHSPTVVAQFLCFISQVIMREKVKNVINTSSRPNLLIVLLRVWKESQVEFPISIFQRCYIPVPLSIFLKALRGEWYQDILRISHISGNYNNQLASLYKRCFAQEKRWNLLHLLVLLSIHYCHNNFIFVYVCPASDTKKDKG